MLTYVQHCQHGVPEDVGDVLPRSAHHTRARISPVCAGMERVGVCHGAEGGVCVCRGQEASVERLQGGGVTRTRCRNKQHRGGVTMSRTGRRERRRKGWQRRNRHTQHTARESLMPSRRGSGPQAPTCCGRNTPEGSVSPGIRSTGTDAQRRVSSMSRSLTGCEQAAAPLRRSPVGPC